MERRFKSVEAYLKALLKRPDELRAFNVSPGWAVEALGVSRQRVREMVREGTLDSLSTDDGFVLLRRAEIVAYRRLRESVPRRAFIGVAKTWMAAKRQRERKPLAFGKGGVQSPAP